MVQLDQLIENKRQQFSGFERRESDAVPVIDLLYACCIFLRTLWVARECRGG